MTDNIDSETVNKILDKNLQNNEEKICKYCNGICINNCIDKLIKEICPRCNIQFTSVSNLERCGFYLPVLLTKK